MRAIGAGGSASRRETKKKKEKEDILWKILIWSAKQKRACLLWKFLGAPKVLYTWAERGDDYHEHERMIHEATTVEHCCLLQRIGGKVRDGILRSIIIPTINIIYRFSLPSDRAIYMCLRFR